LTTRYHGHIIGDKSDKDQDAALRVEMGNPIVMEIKEAKSGEDVTYTLSWPYSLFTSSEEKWSSTGNSGQQISLLPYRRL